MNTIKEIFYIILEAILLPQIFYTILGAILSFIFSWILEGYRVKKEKVIAIKTLFISVYYNQKSFFDERKTLRHRMHEGQKAMLRSHWPIGIDLVDYDYKKAFYFSGEKSGEKILDSLYRTQRWLKVVLKLKQKISTTYEKIRPETRNKVLKNSDFLNKNFIIYEKYISYIDLYLAETSKLIE